MKAKTKIEYIELSKLNLNEKNPRFIKDDRYQQLLDSIKEDPEIVHLKPLIVDEELVVLGGNMRLRAYRELGLDEAPVICISKPSQRLRSAIIIKDNVNYGEFDYDMLANEFELEDLTKWGIELPNIKPIAQTVEVNIDDISEDYGFLRLKFEKDIYEKIIDKLADKEASAEEIFIKALFKKNELSMDN